MILISNLNIKCRSFERLLFSVEQAWWHYEVRIELGGWLTSYLLVIPSRSLFSPKHPGPFTAAPSQLTYNKTKPSPLSLLVTGPCPTKTGKLPPPLP